MAWIETRTAASGRNRWKVVGRDPSGRKVSKMFERKTDARAYRTEIERREQLGTLYKEAPQAFGEFAGLRVNAAKVELTGGGWFERYRASVRRSSFDRRRDVRKHLAELVPLRLDRISPRLIEDLIAPLAAHPRQAKLVMETVKMILKAAETRGQRINADVLRLRPPKHETRDKRFLAADQVEALAQASDEPHLIRVAAFTGLRQGELLALRDEDLDLDRRVVRVTHTLYKGQLGLVKTKAGRRSIPIHPLALQEFRQQLLRRPRGTPYVFPAPKGGPWQRTELSRKFKEWAKSAGLDGLVFHDLRHTFASLAIKSGAHPKVIQALMGHGTWKVTMDTYGHLFEGQTEEAMTALDRMLRADRAGPKAAGQDDPSV